MRPTQLPPPGAIRDLTDREAPDFLESSPLALLAFLDPEEERSRAVRERLEVIAAKLADARLAVGAIDVRSHRLVAEAMGVRAIPLIALFEAGEMVDRLMGAPPAEIIEETVAARLASRRAP